MDYAPRWTLPTLPRARRRHARPEDEACAGPAEPRAGAARDLTEPMSVAALECQLLELRDRAVLTLVDLGREQPEDPAALDDQYAIWNAAELALSVLDPGYAPRREALAGARTVLERAAAGPVAC